MPTFAGALLLIGYSLKHGYKVAPEQIGSGNEESLIRAVHATQGGTEGNHVQLGIFLCKQSTLQSCMNGAYHGVFAEQPTILLYGDTQDLAVRIRFPTGIPFAHFGVGTCQTEGGADGMADIVASAEGGTAL